MADYPKLLLAGALILVSAGTASAQQGRAAGDKDDQFVITAQITRESGSHQREAAGSALPIPLRARVADSFDNPVAGATVTFTVVSGGGSVAGDTAVTNLEGVVTSGVWTLGPALGQQQVTARAGTREIDFTAEACSRWSTEWAQQSKTL